MKSLTQYLNESIISEAKIETVDVSVDTLVNNCRARFLRGYDLGDVLMHVMNMGYKPVSDVPISDKYGTYSFYVFSKGKSSDMVLVACCPRGRLDKECLILAYTTNRSLINIKDNEIIVRAVDGWAKSSHVHLNDQEMVNTLINEADFGNLNDVVKKATWYTKAHFWMKDMDSGKDNIYNVTSFYKD